MFNSMKSILLLTFLLIFCFASRTQNKVEKKIYSKKFNKNQVGKFELEKIREKGSDNGLKITYPLNGDTLSIKSTVQEVPNYLQIRAQSFIEPGDTLICKVYFTSQEDRLVAESTFMWTNKNKVGTEAKIKQIDLLSDFTPVLPSMEVSFFAKRNNNHEKSILLLNELNFLDNASYHNNNNESANVDVYPNPSKSGYIYTIQEPGQFDRIFVKDISEEEVIFEANKKQLDKNELRIDLTNQGSGKYMIIFSNAKTIIRERITIH